MKKYILGFLAAGVLIVPTVSSAATIAELEAQINSLLQQITALQQQFSQSSGSTGSVEGGSGGSTSTASSSGISCPNLRYNLYLGEEDNETDGDVTRLQQFLAQYSDIYPEGQITGYFGPLTEQAVKRWQAKQGLVSSGSPDTTGYGVVGPKTRAKIREACSGIITPTPRPTPNPLPTPPTPSISSISRTTAAPGDTVSVYGSNFEAGSYIAVDNNTWTVTPSLASRTLLIFVVPTGMSIGSHSIQVGQKANDASLSNAFLLSIVDDSQPSITVLSPNGGEVFKPGDVVPIKWSSKNLGNMTVNIDLILSTDGSISHMASFVSNTGVYYWTVSSDKWDGAAYKIMVGSSDKGPSAEDTSDVPFSILQKDFVDLVVDVQNDTNDNTAFVRASIKGNSENSKVSSWKASIGCDSGIIVIGKYDENLCGTEIILNNIYYDVTKDRLILTVGVENTSTINKNALFSLTAYDSNGVALGGDKEFVTLAPETTQPSITILSPNGGETFTTETPPIEIRWTPGSPGIAAIELLNADKSYNQTIYSQKVFGYQVPNTSGSFSWTPYDTGTYYLKLYEYVPGQPDNSGKSSISDGPFTVTPHPPFVTLDPTATVRPNPTLNLIYDANSSEASLVGTFIVDVRAGSGGMSISKTGGFAIIATNQTKGGDRGTNGVATPYGMTIDETPDNWAIPPGGSASFQVKATFYPKVMFTGSYIANVQSIVYGDQNNVWNVLTPPRVYTNSRVIVGEVSPYITSITPTTTTDGTITVTGERLSGNVVEIDYGTPKAKQFATPPTIDGTVIFVVPSQVGIAVGQHSLSILSYATGRSNQVGFEVTSYVIDPIAPSITVLSPNGGESLQAGTVASVKWKWSGNFTKLRIQLLGESATKQFAEVGTGVNSDLGEYTFIIPSNLSGQFKVSICDSFFAAGTFLCDQSDAPFSIVAPAPAPTLALSASASSVTAGQNSTLTWSSTNTSSCSASGAWSGSKSVSGSLPVSPTQTSTYTLTCTGASGSVVKSVTVSVTAPAPMAVFSNGRGSSFMVSLDKAEYRPGETIIAEGSGGVVGVSGWYIFNYTMTAMVNNQEKTLNQVGVNGGNYSGREIFTAPSQPGTYAAEFKTNVSYKKKTNGTVSNDPIDNANYSLSYTVAAPLAVTTPANLNQMASALESAKFLLNQIIAAIKNLKK